MIGKYCYSFDGEIYSGEFDTIEDLRKEVGDQSVIIGQYERRLEFDATGIGKSFVEWLEDRMCDDYETYPLEDSPFEFMGGNSKEIQDKLAGAIENTLHDFFARNPFQYWIVKPIY